MSLENITVLCTYLGNPQDRYPVIHIAGTNGKGSTAYLIYKILMAHGLSAGLYTSPHLKKFNERIRINDKLVPDIYLSGYWQKIKTVVNRINATFFDTTTALAFNYFADKKVDLAIIETGLGGRLDATNIVKPKAAVITPIDFDHVKHLGNDILSITKEKAAIIKENAKTFSAKQRKSVKNYLNSCGIIEDVSECIEIVKAQINRFDSLVTFRDKTRNLLIENTRLSLAGRHQIENLVLAYRVSRWYLEQINISFNEQKFQRVLTECTWPGRFQRISISPMIIADVCHNSASFRSIAEHLLQTFKNEQSYLLIGLIDDKAYKEILEIISPLFSSITITEPIHDHPLPGNILQSELVKMDKEAIFIKDMHKAYEFMKKGLAANDWLFILGSHYLIGNLRN